MPPREWSFRVADILERIERIRGYIHGMKEEQFRTNHLVIDAVVRNLEVIGEAAANLPEDIVQANPDVPWREMRDMRNLLVHEYFGVSLPIVWRTVTHELPPLVPVLRRILSTGEKSPAS